MRKLLVLFLAFYSCANTLSAQCKNIAVNEIDPFDSTRLIAAKPVNVGYKIPSQFTLPDGNNKMIEEGKVMFTYAENDTINTFYITLALAEYNYYPIETGYNVWLLLGNKKVVGLYNIPDKGEFNKDTNMRIYQHTCVAPLDLFYVLTYTKISKIRVEYNGYKKTLEILPKQQEALLEAIRCVGEAAGLYPVKP